MNNVHRDLLSNASATGDWMEWPGGWGAVTAEGDWSGGGTVTVQIKGPQGGAISGGANVTFTANGAGAFLAPPGQIRAAVTGTVAAMYVRAVSVRG